MKGKSCHPTAPGSTPSFWNSMPYLHLNMWILDWLLQSSLAHWWLTSPSRGRRSSLYWGMPDNSLLLGVRHLWTSVESGCGDGIVWADLEFHLVQGRMQWRIVLWDLSEKLMLHYDSIHRIYFSHTLGILHFRITCGTLISADGRAKVLVVAVIFLAAFSNITFLTLWLELIPKKPVWVVPLLNGSKNFKNSLISNKFF